jgi:hypothetical protein
MTRGWKKGTSAGCTHREMIENYDESVVVYGSGFVCHVEEVSAAVYAPMMMAIKSDAGKAPCGVDTL